MDYFPGYKISLKIEGREGGGGVVTSIGRGVSDAKSPV